MVTNQDSNQSGQFFSKVTPTINNSWNLQETDKLDNHAINHLHNSQTVNVNKQWVLHNSHH